jgi:hypothetical protein
MCCFCLKTACLPQKLLNFIDGAGMLLMIIELKGDAVCHVIT